MPRTTSTRNTTPPITLPAMTAALDVEDAVATAVEDSASVEVEDDASTVGAGVEDWADTSVGDEVDSELESAARLETGTTTVVVGPALVELPGGGEVHSPDSHGPTRVW